MEKKLTVRDILDSKGKRKLTQVWVDGKVHSGAFPATGNTADVKDDEFDKFMTAIG